MAILTSQIYSIHTKIGQNVIDLDKPYLERQN